MGEAALRVRIRHAVAVVAVEALTAVAVDVHGPAAPLRVSPPHASPGAHGVFLAHVLRHAPPAGARRPRTEPALARPVLRVEVPGHVALAIGDVGAVRAAVLEMRLPFLFRRTDRDRVTCLVVPVSDVVDQLDSVDDGHEADGAGQLDVCF